MFRPRTALGHERPNANWSLGSRRVCRWMGRNVPIAEIRATPRTPSGGSPSAASTVRAARFLGAVHTPCSGGDDGDPRDHVCGPFLCRLLGGDVGITG